MKNIYYLLTALCLAACSNEVEEFAIQDIQGNAPQDAISFTMTPFEAEEGSRTNYDINASGVTITWAEGDVLGVFPGTGNQTAFNISAGAGSTYAVFDGQDWRLRENAQYAAYFPLQREFDLDKNHIEVDYSGQTQDGNNSTAHLGQYDFMYASFITTNENGNCNFQMKHLGTMARFQLTMPEADTYTSFKLTTSAGEFTKTAYYGLTTGASSLTKLTGETTFTLGLQNITTTAANQVITLYAMMAPGDYSAATWTLEVVGNNGTYTQTTAGKNIAAGKAIGSSVSFVPATAAMLLDGQEFNAAIKTLANGTSMGYYSDDWGIYSINFEVNSSISTGTLVSKPTSSVPAYANYNSSTHTMTISTSASKYESTDMSWMFAGCNALTTLDVSSFDTHNVTNMSGMFSNCRALTSLDVSSFDTHNVTNMSGMFSNCRALTTLDVSNFDTQNVTDMGSMFSFCKALTSLDVSNFDTQNVTDMSSMFDYCNALTTLDVSHFDTQNVTDMNYMFCGCYALTTLDVSHFDTQNVTDMSWMFSDCRALTSLDVSSFDTQNVTSMYCMFYDCFALTSLDLSNFDTQNVTDMSNMFYNCTALTTLDLSNFDTRNVTDMCAMFSYCEALTTLDLSNFDTRDVTYMSEMFYYCTALTSLDVSNFDTQNVTNMGYMFDGCIALTALDLGTDFVIGSTCDKTSMCNGLALNSHACTISCTSDTQTKLRDGTTELNESYITWNILP